jgi:hypothetical protein
MNGDGLFGLVIIGIICCVIGALLRAEERLTLGTVFLVAGAAHIVPVIVNVWIITIAGKS